MKKNVFRKLVCGVVAGAAAFAVLSPAVAEESIQSKVLTLVSKMTAEQQQALYDFLTKTAAPAAPAPEKALADNVKKVKEFAVKQDLDGVMNLVAEDFQQSQLGGKGALKVFLQGLLASGEIAQYAKDTEISTGNAKIKVEGDKASVDPVEVVGPWGSASLSFTAKLVNGEWKITGAELH